MSCYEHEQGTIVIPKPQYVKFRKAIITEHNRLEDVLHGVARMEHNRLVAAAKGKRNFDYYQEYEDGFRKSHLTDDQRHRVYLLLWPYEEGKPRVNRNRKPIIPRKGDLQKKPLSRECQIQLEEAFVVFDDKSHSVRWAVQENNHACETARGQPLAIFFFKKLDAIQWTARSGGQILGNNEYNRESGNDCEGGGGSIVTGEYSAKKQQAERRASRPAYSPFISHGGPRL